MNLSQVNLDYDYSKNKITGTVCYQSADGGYVRLPIPEETVELLLNNIRHYLPAFVNTNPYEDYKREVVEGEIINPLDGTSAVVRS